MRFASTRRGSSLRSTPRTTPEDEKKAAEAILQLDSLDFVFDCFCEMIPYFGVCVISASVRASERACVRAWRQPAGVGELRANPTNVE